MGRKISRSTPKKKPSKVPASMAGRDLGTVVCSMLESLPGISVQKKFHNTSFLVAKKVFAFTRRDDVVMKLPEGKIQELMDKRRASHLVMGKRVMREWVVIQHNDPGGYREDLGLFKEAMTFVSSLRK